MHIGVAQCLSHAEIASGTLPPVYRPHVSEKKAHTAAHVDLEPETEIWSSWLTECEEHQLCFKIGPVDTCDNRKSSESPDFRSPRQISVMPQAIPMVFCVFVTYPHGTTRGHFECHGSERF